MNYKVCTHYISLIGSFQVQEGKWGFAGDITSVPWVQIPPPVLLSELHTQNAISQSDSLIYI